MKILFISQYFFPESFKGNDIVFDLCKRGHKVTVLTAKPNYPYGRFFKGYNFFNKRIEFIKGAKVIRTPIIPRGNGSGIMLFLNYFSFILFSYFAVLFRIREKYDVIFVQQLSPVTMALPGIWVKKNQKVPLILWVLDLWPESITAASNIKNKYLINQLDHLVCNIYNNSDKILISSFFFKHSIYNKIKDKSKEIIYFPNWAEDIFLNPGDLTADIPSFPNGFNIMFAGNIGEAQDFESILNAAEITKNKAPSINWIFVGDGRKLNWIKTEIKNRNLNNVYLFGRYPVHVMPHLFKKADIMLVTLKNEPIFSLTVPAKIQAYMASKKIILAMLNGEGAEIIQKANCGYSVPAGEYKKLAQRAISLSLLSYEEKLYLEQNAMEYYRNNFDKNKSLINLENLIKSLNIK